MAEYKYLSSPPLRKTPKSQLTAVVEQPSTRTTKNQNLPKRYATSKDKEEGAIRWQMGSFHDIIKSHALQTKNLQQIHTKKRKSNPNNIKYSHQITREQKRKGRKKTYKNKSKTINKMALKTYILIITLNVSGLNNTTKRHTLADWIQKQDLFICCLQKTHFLSRDIYRLKVRGWKKCSM